MAEAAAPKLAMIGFDAADVDYIRSQLPSLPNFRRAFDSGLSRRLRSPADLLPGSVWPTFYTARSPGEHGVYHIVQWDADAMRLPGRTLPAKGVRPVPSELPVNGS